MLTFNFKDLIKDVPRIAEGDTKKAAVIASFISIMSISKTIDGAVEGMKDSKIHSAVGKAIATVTLQEAAKTIDDFGCELLTVDDAANIITEYMERLKDMGDLEEQICKHAGSDACNAHDGCEGCEYHGEAR